MNLRVGFMGHAQRLKNFQGTSTYFGKFGILGGLDVSWKSRDSREMREIPREFRSSCEWRNCRESRSSLKSRNCRTIRNTSSSKNFPGNRHPTPKVTRPVSDILFYFYSYFKIIYFYFIFKIYSFQTFPETCPLFS